MPEGLQSVGTIPLWCVGGGGGGGEEGGGQGGDDTFAFHLILECKTNKDISSQKPKASPLTTCILWALLGSHILSVASSDPVQINLPEKAYIRKITVLLKRRKTLEILQDKQGCTIWSEITTGYTTSMT